jgi:DNA-binding transcriptional MerR regulator
MSPLTIQARLNAIGNHLKDIHTAYGLNNPERAANHSAIIEDHLAEIRALLDDLKRNNQRILG